MQSIISLMGVMAVVVTVVGGWCVSASLSTELQPKGCCLRRQYGDEWADDSVTKAACLGDARQPFNKWFGKRVRVRLYHSGFKECYDSCVPVDSKGNPEKEGDSQCNGNA